MEWISIGEQGRAEIIPVLQDGKIELIASIPSQSPLLTASVPATVPESQLLPSPGFHQGTVLCLAICEFSVNSDFLAALI